MINCVNCHQSIKQVALNWYQPECQLIKELISNEDLVSIISSFLYHLMVIESSTLENIEQNLIILNMIVILKLVAIMSLRILRYTPLFQKALKRSLENQHRLPYLRTDIGYFLMIHITTQ